MGTKKFDFFWKKFEVEFDLYFDLCWRAEIIQVGLNMHLYVDIGDASSSLWGSTSSSTFFSGDADSLCEHFEPSHTVFIDSQFMLWCYQTSSFPPRWNRATGVEMTNPKTADICKMRRVKGLVIILIEKVINFI